MIGTFTSTKPFRQDVYNTSSKQIVVPRDPIYCRPVKPNGLLHVSKQPPTYMAFAIVLAFVNPLLAPVAIVFSYLSIRAFKQGDLIYAERWSQYAFLACLTILVVSLILYIVICFALSTISYRGGISY